MNMGVDDDLLDNELRPIMLDQRARNALRPALTTIDPVTMRARAAAEFEVWNSVPAEVAVVRDFSIDGPACSIPVRLYDPRPGSTSGLLVYFHGGGWIIGDLDLEDGALRRIAAESGVKILSVHYRLAPEHMFPAAIEDGEAVIRWAVDNAGDLGIDPAHIGVGGSSAGANVALGTALRLRDTGGPALAHLLLLHGAFSGGEEVPSHRKFGDGRFGLPAAAMNFFWNVYLGDDRSHPHAVPLKADLTGLPPALIMEAELDMLADESRLLADRLRAAGGIADHRVYVGAIHGFTQYSKASALARRALGEAANEVAAHLGAGR
jgi:acetyl esterase